MADNPESSKDLRSSLTELYDLVEEGFAEEDLSLPLCQELKDISERYIDAEVIARGGMKTISKVFDNKTSRYVAMAELHEGAPLELYEPFLREARLTALLDHPNIISVYDISLKREETPFFTMELEEGESLQKLIEAAHEGDEGLDFVKLNDFLEILLKVCDAIAYAHTKKIVHLDLKPDNIQTDHHGQVTICDWGLSKILGDPDYDGGEFDRLLLNPDLLNHMTVAGEFRGTPGFMAPEQLEPDQELDEQTDIYSLGAVLYTVLTGLAPIDVADYAGDVDLILEKSREGKILAPEKRCSTKGIPLALSAVCMKALSLNKESRYKGVEGLRKDLSNFMTGYSTTAEDAGFLTETKLFFQRNKVICLVALLTLSIVTSLTYFFIVGLKEQKQEAESAKKLAEQNQNIAIKEKERAERILKLYEQEKESISSFVESHFNSLKEKGLPQYGSSYL